MIKREVNSNLTNDKSELQIFDIHNICDSKTDNNCNVKRPQDYLYGDRWHIT